MGGYTKNYQRALRDGAKVRATVKVISETKEVITNANVRLFFRMTYGKSAGEIIRGTSNEEGIFSAEERTTDIVFITVEKNGYYTSRTRHVAQSTEAGRLVNGRWLPWDPTIPVILRKIENPIPMYVKSFSNRSRHIFVHAPGRRVRKRVGHDTSQFKRREV